MKRIFTQSEFSTFKSCRFKHFLKYEKCLKRPGKSIAALLGRGGHAGLESLYLNGDAGKALRATELFFNQFRDDYLNQVDNNRPFMYDKWTSTRDLALAILTHYCAFYGFKSGKHEDPDFHVIPGMVELPFQVPIPMPGGEPSLSFELAGRIDLVVEHADRYWIGDHKFKVDVNDSLQGALQISFQMKCYVLALRIFTGLPVAGGFWNVVKRKAPSAPSINKNGTVSLSKVDTTPEIYAESLAKQDAILRRESGKGLDYSKYEKEIERLNNIRWFGRFYCEYSDEELMEVQREIYETALSIQECSQNKGMTSFRNDISCMTFGACEYGELCRGIASGNAFTYDPNPHGELPKQIISKYLWPGFVLPERSSLTLTGFEDAFNSV